MLILCDTVAPHLDNWVDPLTARTVYGIFQYMGETP